jgi:hypothetical protein
VTMEAWVRRYLAAVGLWAASALGVGAVPQVHQTAYMATWIGCGLCLTIIHALKRLRE